jgi:hypothetical protein
MQPKILTAMGIGEGESMFEVNGVYRNRIGQYQVLSFSGPKMKVRYEDGATAELNVSIQERIWENILAEQEARAASNRYLRSLSKDTNHYIKAVSIPPGEELLFPGWQERVVMVLNEEQAQKIKAGDRLIYYAVEAQTFFGVVTITGDMFTADPKQYTFTAEVDKAFFFPVDIDAASVNLEAGVTIDSVELESIPDFRQTRVEAGAFYKISEDDFELLAEALTEITEGEEEDLEDLDEFEEDDAE